LRHAIGLLNVINELDANQEMFLPTRHHKIDSKNKLQLESAEVTGAEVLKAAIEIFLLFGEAAVLK
jgi:hypothetical protein